MDKKKGLIVLLAVLVLTGIGFSTEKAIRQGSFEVVLGSYSINEPRFEAVYPKGGMIGGVALSANLVSNFNAYMEIKYYSRVGELSFTGEKTELSILPLSFGARYIYPLPYLSGMFHPYGGGGFDVYFYYEDNPIGTVLNSTSGYHLMGGTYIRFLQGFPLMLNLKLKYTWAEAKENNIQLGGLEFAFGFVLAF